MVQKRLRGSGNVFGAVETFLVYCRYFWCTGNVLGALGRFWCIRNVYDDFLTSMVQCKSFWYTGNVYIAKGTF